MGPTGMEENDGLTPATPVGTLDRVKEIAENISEDIDVQVYPTTYEGESVVWDNPIRAGQVITFRPWEGESGRPRFVGPGLSESKDNAYNTAFFTLQSPSGVPTNIRFWHLQVEQYKDGIILNGSSSDHRGWNSDNQVVDVWFVRVGDKWAGDGDKHGYKALGLTNSRYNYVRHNLFIECENAGKPELIHGIYLAHWSTHNDIRYNLFYRVSGDAIKTRDQSGDNIVWANAFWMSGQDSATVGDWYSNPNKVSAHREHWERNGERWECPSAMNNVRYNVFGQNYTETATLPQVTSVRPEDCPNYVDAEYFKDARQEYSCPCGRNRFTTANNDYTPDSLTITNTVTGWEADFVVDWRAENNIK